MLLSWKQQVNCARTDYQCVLGQLLEEALLCRTVDEEMKRLRGHR